MEVWPLCSGGTRPADGCVLALGFFDGMHRGHAALLRRTVQIAAERGAIPAVFTFAEDDSIKRGVPRLLTEEERLARMAQAGIQRVFHASFSALRTLSPAAFVEQVLLAGCHAEAVVSGFNFRFGHQAAGDTACLAALLAPHGVPLSVLPPVLEQGEPVSASAIRLAVMQGDVEQAARLLGRPFSLTGPVLHGKALGRTRGYPTANQALPAGAVTPAYGVYAVACACGQVYTPAEAPLRGICNVGVRPTVDVAGQANCETHLFDHTADLYGTPLTVFFLHRIRGEMHFASLDALYARLEQDKQEAKEFLKKWENGQN